MMDWSALKKWIPGRKFKPPAAGIYKVRQEDLPTLRCQRCEADLSGLPLTNQGGGPFVLCGRCKSRHYLRGY